MSTAWGVPGTALSSHQLMASRPPSSPPRGSASGLAFCRHSHERRVPGGCQNRVAVAHTDHLSPARWAATATPCRASPAQGILHLQNAASGASCSSPTTGAHRLRGTPVAPAIDRCHVAPSLPSHACRSRYPASAGPTLVAAHSHSMVLGGLEETS